MRRFLLAAFVALIAVSTSSVMDLVVPEPCSIDEANNGQEDRDCAATCVRCNCCARSEIRRVLKPGGRLFFEEITRQALARWSYRTFLRHPAEDRFSGDEFVLELQRQNILVLGNVVYRLFGDLVIGVGQRPLGNV